MKVLLTGADGQLGRELRRTAPAAVEIHAASRAELDLTRGDAVDAKLESLRPRVVLNAAAYTRVDDAESEPELARAVNAEAVGRLAVAAARLGARLVTVSTDFVFRGDRGRPYRPQDATDPLGVYGATKLEGERRALAAGGKLTIVRTSWLYSRYGRNFVKTMLRLMAERDEVAVVVDQVGSPTWAKGLAEVLWRAAGGALDGVWHWSDAGVASWYDLAVAVEEEARELGLLERAITVRPIPTSDFPTPAERPAHSVLDAHATRRELGLEPVHWRQALRRMLTELNEAGGADA